MKSKIDIAAHIILGLIFFVFGLNGFLNFIPAPELTGNTGKFMEGMAAAPYFFPLLKITEMVAGFMLLIRRFVPLALLLLAPIVVNILFFHITMEPGGILVAIVVTLLTAYLGFSTYIDSFRTVLLSRPEP